MRYWFSEAPSGAEGGRGLRDRPNRMVQFGQKGAGSTRGLVDAQPFALHESSATRSLVEVKSLDRRESHPRSAPNSARRLPEAILSRRPSVFFSVTLNAPTLADLADPSRSR
ncbi:hypothetical protein HN011_009929 [Eciton burchellii]|nr:hypothetical protein HN011_009929 [Eciton burchellii]